MGAPGKKEVPFAEQFRLFVGFDWAKDHHDAVAVYPLNPKSAERYRDRKAPAGVKDDLLDAWSIGDGLRTDGHGWRQLREEDPLTQELRLLCRDEVALIEQRTALICQLQEALHEYYPAALDAFDDWTAAGAWEFIARFPTPQKLVQAGKRRWEKFLHAQRLFHPATYAGRLDVFARADQFGGRPGVVNAKSRLALAIVVQLRALQSQLRQYRAAIEELFARHPDRDLFDSLPGIGDKLGPRLAAEMGQDRGRFQDHESLQCLAGTAPVTKQSGKSRWVQFRRACNKHLRATVFHWARLSMNDCAWAAEYYRHKRQHGMSHACALRCLGQRWIKILWKMWQTHAVYNETLHTRNQIKHGSWTISLT
jgi:transposase